jgi:hypothetical protein
MFLAHSGFLLAHYNGAKKHPQLWKKGAKLSDQPMDLGRLQ